MKNKNLTLVKDDFIPKNKTHRRKLYEKVFLKHNTESLLFTLHKEAINLTSKTAIVALDLSSENLAVLAEAIGDLNIAVEVNETAIPKLHEVSIGSKYRKLTTLKDNTDKAEAKEAETAGKNGSEVKEEADLAKAFTKAEKAIKEFGDSIPPKRSFLGFFKHCWNY